MSRMHMHRSLLQEGLFHADYGLSISLFDGELSSMQNKLPPLFCSSCRG